MQVLIFDSVYSFVLRFDLSCCIFIDVFINIFSNISIKTYICFIYIKAFKFATLTYLILQKKLFIKLQIMSESNSNPHIYDKFRSSDKQIDFLMSDKG